MLKRVREYQLKRYMDYCLIARCINNFHITHGLICPELSTRACVKNGLMYFYMHMNINAVASSDAQKMSGKIKYKLLAWPPGAYTY